MTSYVTADEVRAQMPDVEWSVAYHATLTALITRASRLIDRATGREDGAYASDTATVRYFDGSGQREQWLPEMAAAPTAVAVDEGGAGMYTTWASTDYFTWPYNAADEGKPYVRLDVDQLNGDKSHWYRFPRSVKVTAKWGYSTAAPDDVKQAVIIQVIRYFKRAQQAYQDTGAIVELGQLRYVNKLDPDVALLVDHYRRVAI